MSDTNTTVLKAEEAKDTLFEIPFECIGTYNVREVLPQLPEQYTYESMLRLAIGTADQKAEMVKVIEAHEDAVLKADPKAQTLIMLAQSIFDNGQLQAVLVRQTGQVARRDTDGKAITGEKRYGYMMVLGGRRTMAKAYLYALGLTNQNYIVGRQKKMNKEEALDMSIAENLQRKDFTEAEIGGYVAMYRDNGKTWEEIATKMRRSEQTLRDSYLLVRPMDPTAPADLAAQVDAGTLTKGQAVEIAKGKTKLGDGGQRLFRTVRKALSVKAIETLIDKTPRDDTAVVRITALAECLNSTYEVELAASDKRLADAKAKADAEAKKTADKAADEARKAQIDALKGQIAGLKTGTVVTVTTVTETTTTAETEAA